MASFFEFKGKYAVISLIVLTAVVGALFIVMGPQATEKSPGVLHVGIRYLDENSMRFAQYPKSGPGAAIEFVDAEGAIIYRFENLKIGRNLVPIEPDNIPSGNYTARVSARDYQSVELPIIIEGRMLNPAIDAEFEAHTHADYNMIGVRFQLAEN
ncbi:MAG: hypothetical protein ACPGKS_04910 [Coraliomargarita sp.]